jgi:hypothetical protein
MSRTQGHSAAESMSKKNSIDTIGIRSLDLPVFTDMPRPIAPPPTPTYDLYVLLVFYIHVNNTGILYYSSQAGSQRKHLDEEKDVEFLVSSGFLNHCL